MRGKLNFHFKKTLYVVKDEEKKAIIIDAKLLMFNIRTQLTTEI